jgi:phage gp29-like protein
VASEDQKASPIPQRMGKKMSGVYKKEKKTLLNKLDKLDKKAENSLLDETELNLKHVLNERLAELL